MDYSAIGLQASAPQTFHAIACSGICLHVDWEHQRGSEHAASDVHNGCLQTTISTGLTLQAPSRLLSTEEHS